MLKEKRVELLEYFRLWAVQEQFVESIMPSEFVMIPLLRSRRLQLNYEI